MTKNKTTSSSKNFSGCKCRNLTIILSIISIVTISIIFAFINYKKKDISADINKKEEIIVYSLRHYAKEREIIEKIAGEIGVKVNFVQTKADVFPSLYEGKKPDLVILHSLSQLSQFKDIIQGKKYDTVDMPFTLNKDLQGEDWFPLAFRGRFLYVEKDFDLTTAPKINNFIDIADISEIQNVCVGKWNKAYNIVLLSHIISILDTNNTHTINEKRQNGKIWLEKMIAKTSPSQPEGGDKSQMVAVGYKDPRCTYSIGNHYYGFLDHPKSGIVYDHVKPYLGFYTSKSSGESYSQGEIFFDTSIMVMISDDSVTKKIHKEFLKPENLIKLSSLGSRDLPSFLFNEKFATNYFSKKGSEISMCYSEGKKTWYYPIHDNCNYIVDIELLDSRYKINLTKIIDNSKIAADLLESMT